MSINPDTFGEPVPTDFADVFDDWIAGASIAKRSVVIYGKPGLFAEYEQIERELEVARESEKHGAELAGSDVARLEQQLEELYAEWVASKSTWVVRGVTPETLERAKAQEPAIEEPTAPEAPELPKNATDQQKRAHTVAMQRHAEAVAEYEAATDVYNDEINLRCIAWSTLSIEFSDGRKVEAQIDDDGEVIAPVVGVDRLRNMKRRLGEAQLLKILSAAQMATVVEPEIPAPFSRSTSESDPTS